MWVQLNSIVSSSFILNGVEGESGSGSWIFDHPHLPLHLYCTRNITKSQMAYFWMKDNNNECLPAGVVVKSFTFICISINYGRTRSFSNNWPYSLFRPPMTSKIKQSARPSLPIVGSNYLLLLTFPKRKSINSHLIWIIIKCLMITTCLYIWYDW